MHFHFFCVWRWNFQNEVDRSFLHLKTRVGNLKNPIFFLPSNFLECPSDLVGVNRTRTSDLRSDSNGHSANPIELSDRYELVLNINSAWILTKNWGLPAGGISWHCCNLKEGGGEGRNLANFTSLFRAISLPPVEPVYIIIFCRLDDQVPRVVFLKIELVYYRGYNCYSTYFLFFFTFSTFI